MQLRELARITVAELDSKAGELLVAKFVGKRIVQALSFAKFESQRRFGELVAPPLITAGTVSVILGGTSIVGDAVAQAAWLVTPPNRGQLFRTESGGPIYQIGTFVPPDTLRLEVQFAEPTAAATGYELITRFHSLNKDARHVLSMQHDDNFIEEITVADLDHNHPDRRSTAEQPVVWAPAGLDDAGSIRIEVPVLLDGIEVGRGAIEGTLDALQQRGVLTGVVSG